jgi:hypothetical protein
MTDDIEKTSKVDVVAFSFKIDEDIMEKIKKMADKERRSITQQMIYLMQKGMECGE